MSGRVLAYVRDVVAVLSGLVLTCTASARAGLEPPDCSGAIGVPERSFQQLPSPAKYAYVWVDDIDSKVFGGYNPFPVYVLVGGTYSPFQARSGKLDRTLFDKVSQAAYDAKRFGPLLVSSATVQNGRAVLGFTSGPRKLSIKVVGVTSRLVGEDSMQLQLCW
jgi:hypothetical protein